MNKYHLLFVLCPVFVLTSLALRAADVPAAPVELTGTQGKFDFIKIDAPRHRLLACHTGNGSLDIIDLAAARLVKSVPTGAAQGVAIDDKGGRYFVSVSKPPQLAVVDAGTLEVTGTVPLPGPADLVAYHPETDRVFVCNDEKPELWIIDPQAKKITTTLTLPGGGMEDLDFNAPGQFLFQCLKDSSTLAKIDIKEAKLLTTWPTSPAEKPHGLAMIPDKNAVLIVGGNGQLILLNLGTGKGLASCAVAPRTDEIAYDAGNQRVYCASGTGTISVVEVAPDKLTPLAPLTSAPGAHSIAVDPQTHTVWITFARDKKAYVQAFTVK